MKNNEITRRNRKVPIIAAGCGFKDALAGFEAGGVLSALVSQRRPLRVIDAGMVSYNPTMRSHKIRIRIVHQFLNITLSHHQPPTFHFFPNLFIFISFFANLKKGSTTQL